MDLSELRYLEPEPPPPVASKDSLKTIARLEALINKRFPLKSGFVEGRWVIPEDIEKNKLLHAAFERYKHKVVTQPNAVFDYIRTQVLDKHASDPTAGLTRAEWTVLATAIALRVIPTMLQLQRRDAALREKGYHVDAYTDNIGDEGGLKGKRSHIQLLFESFHQMNKVLGTDLPEDYETYDMVYHLIRLRREGITFEPPPADSKNQEQRIKEILSIEFPYMKKIAAPLMTAGGKLYEALPEAMQDKLYAPMLLGAAAIAAPEGKKIERYNALEKQITQYPRNKELKRFEDLLAEQGEKILHHSPISYAGGAARVNKKGAPWEVRSLDDRAFDYIFPPYKPASGNLMPRYYQQMQFERAQRIAALMPNEIIDYRDRTASDEGLSLVTQNIDTTTREGSAAKYSHIDAYHRLTQRLLGAFGSYAEKWRAYLWSYVHVGNHGVEPDHAEKALKLITEMVSDPELKAEELTKSFDYVVNQGYLYNQPRHWDAAVKAMSDARVQELKNTPPEEAIIQQCPHKPGPVASWGQTINETRKHLKANGGVAMG